MESALEEIEFLALSSNRVEVLRLLAAEPHARGELAAETGASQATLGRVIADFEARSWIHRTSGEYVATATGCIVADGFTDLLDSLETEQGLRDIVQYLPTDAMDFDLRHLADATITVPSQTRPGAPIQRLLDLLRDAGEVRAFSHAFNDRAIRVVQERVSAGQQRFSGVFSPEAIDALAADDRLRSRLESLRAESDASLRVRNNGVPLAVMIADDTVHLLLRDDNGVLQASLESTAPAVHGWAVETFNTYLDSAEPLSNEGPI